MYIEGDLQAVKRIFIDYPKQLKLVNEELSKVIVEERDLQHALELGRLNATQIMKVSSQMIVLLRKRRDLKNEIELLEAVHHLKDKVREHEITNTIGRVRKIESNQKCRSYTMRIRTDLQKFVE